MADANGNGRVTTKEFYDQLLKILPALQRLEDEVGTIKQQVEKNSAALVGVSEHLQRRQGARKLGTIIWRAAVSVGVLVATAAAAWAAWVK